MDTKALTNFFCNFSARQLIVAAIAALIVICLTSFFLTRDVEELRDAVRGVLESARASNWSFPIVLGLYLLAAATMFPVIILNLGTAMVFGPIWGFVYALSGTLLASTTFFTIGRFGRKRGLKKIFAGPRMGKLDHKINEAGVIGMAALRLVPLAPFGIFNMVAGITSITFLDYIAGTFLGFLPGGIARALVGDSLVQLFLEPSADSLLYLGCGLVLWAAIVLSLHFGLKKYRAREADTP